MVAIAMRIYIEEGATLGGDVPRSYPHAFDAIALSSHKPSRYGGIEARNHLIYWEGSSYSMY